MTKIVVKSYDDISSLIYAIIFFIIGATLFSNPDGVIKLISYFIGLTLILTGVFKLYTYYRLKKRNLVVSKFDCTTGLVSIIIGIVTIVCSSAIETSIRFIMGAWILYSGISRLILAISMYEESKANVIPLLLIAIFLIGFAIYMILKSNLVVSLIGVFIMIYAVMEIIGYVLYKVSKK